MRLPELVLIDLDGTLVDSVPDLAASVDVMRQQLDLAPWGEAQVRHWVGNGVERLVKRALTGTLDGEPDAALYARALPLFMDHYGANTSTHSCLFPGIAEGLAQLQQRGCRLGCVTNKAARFTEPLLTDLGIRDRFEVVVSGDTLPQKKPDPAPLLHAASTLGIAPAASLMVGDSQHDVAAARAAGFAVVCVTYGYNHGEPIAAANPDAVIDALPQLLDLLTDE